MGKKKPIGICLTLAWATTAEAAVQGQEVTYRAGETVLKGYLAYDDSTHASVPASWWCRPIRGHSCTDPWQAAGPGRIAGPAG